MNFTPEQSTAIHTHHHNLIVLAGAGSGKTRVLVERYLALLRDNDWPLNALVAVTFTRKAAGEMRDRVRQSLEQAYHSAATDAQRHRWGELLAAMDSARIDTIHGLCTSLLRANAAAAGVDPDFAVLDETDAVVLLDDVIDAVLDDLADQGDPAIALFQEYEASAIRSVLHDSAARAAARATDDPQALLARWQQQWQAGVPAHTARFLTRVNAIGTVEPAEDDAIGRSWATCLAQLDALHQGPTPEDILSALNILATLPMRGGSAKRWGGEESFAHAKATLKDIRTAACEALDEIGEAVGIDPGAVDSHAAHLLALWSRLLTRVDDGYRAVKAASAWLDFDDLEAAARDLLAHPEVRSRYRGTEFRHVLVDEFQDTNAAQWDIIQSLTGLENPGSLFVVGDSKQSIYAFRGADVSVFGEVRQQIASRGGVLVEMVSSFRTHKPLVDHLNRVFARLLVRDPDSPAHAYQVELGTPMLAARQHAPANPVEDAAEFPALELLLIDASRAAPPPGTPKLYTEDRRRREAVEIAGRIQAMVAAGRRIYDKEHRLERPMHYGDVAILFQSLSHVTLYEEVFKAAGLRYVTVAGRGYYDRQEVWDLLNLLNALYNPADELALMSALRSPLFSLSDDALLALRLAAQDRGESVWEVLAAPGGWPPADEQAAIAQAHQVLRTLQVSAGRVTIAELLRDALARTGYLAVLTGLPDGERRRLNVEKLLHKAQSASTTTLGTFTAYLRDLSAREVREGEAASGAEGVLQIMSVHASKGLEFPVVILADASWDRGNRSSSPVIVDDAGRLACRVLAGTESDSKPPVPFAYRRAQAILAARDEAERLRLLYVAATRAQDALLISGQVAFQETAQRWTASGWLGRLLSALDLEGDLRDGAYDWGRLRWIDPYTEVSGVQAQPSADDPPAWALPAVQAGTALPGAATPPPLLHPITVQRIEQTRHLAATHIADLGSLADSSPDDHAFYQARFRRQVLHDAPATVEWVSHRLRRVSARHIGDIVHEALRWWRFPGDLPPEDYDAQLRSYAWRFGLADEALCAEAAQRAAHLLRQFKAGALYQAITEAAAVYRELPFLYERDGHIIHGVIDVLFRDRDGRWSLVDYKTSTVPRGEHQPGLVTRHARRYHLQVGVYADAVSQQLNGAAPEIFIHYIRYGETVPVTAAEWQAALSHSIHERISELVAFTEDKAL